MGCLGYLFVERPAASLIDYYLTMAGLSSTKGSGSMSNPLSRQIFLNPNFQSSVANMEKSFGIELEPTLPCQELSSSSSSSRSAAAETHSNSDNDSSHGVKDSEAVQTEVQMDGPSEAVTSAPSEPIKSQM